MTQIKYSDKKMLRAKKPSGEKFSNTPASIGDHGNFLDMAKLIRSLQRAEGQEACFKRPFKNCRSTDCCWREYCLQKDQYAELKAQRRP